MEAEDSFVGWQTEKLPLDVLAYIFRLVLEGGKRCGLCGRLFCQEVKNPQMVACLSACRRWKLAWGRLIISSVRAERFPFCKQPMHCLMDYLHTAPKHPFISVFSGFLK
jgi:hypothetical protein